VHYFDNSATSYPKPEKVYSFMDKYYRENGFNAKRSRVLNTKNLSPDQLIEKTREMIQELFNAKDKSVYFLASATVATNVILQGLDYRTIKIVYITAFEHNAVLRTLYYLQKIYTFEVVELSMDAISDQYDLEKIKYQFQKAKPDLVIINHASNVSGLIAPISEICTMAKKSEAVTIVDIAQSAGQIGIDLSPNIYDFAIFAGHKSLMASMGIGGFISNNSITLKPLIYGGTGVDSSNLELPSEGPERFEVGSTNIVALSSLYAALQYISEVGLDTIIKKKRQIMTKLLELLQEYSDIKFYRSTTNNQYVNVISINYKGYSSDNIGEILAKQNITVRTGLHCAPNAHKYLGTFPEGTVRLSVSSFTSDEDLKALEKALDYIEENS